MFVSWLAQSLSPASVYLAAVRSYHIDWGYRDPTQNKPRLRRVLQGIHRSHGAATSAAAVGLPDHFIQTLGRWTSQAYRRYIRTAPDTFLSVAPLV